MKGIFAMVILLGWSLSSYAQHWEQEMDIDSSIFYVGEIRAENLENDTLFGWYRSGYQNYQVDSSALGWLASELSSCQLVIFMGTWCSDSHQLIPSLFRLLDELNFPDSSYQMFALDPQKEDRGSGEVEKYQIEWVPTMLVIRDGKELGRIVETTYESIELDLIQILKEAEGTDRD